MTTAIRIIVTALELALMGAVISIAADYWSVGDTARVMCILLAGIFIHQVAWRRR